MPKGNHKLGEKKDSDKWLIHCRSSDSHLDEIETPGGAFPGNLYLREAYRDGLVTRGRGSTADPLLRVDGKGTSSKARDSKS